MTFPDLQTSLPLHIESVASNDVLYAGDPTYIDTLCDMLREVVDACVTELAALREQAKTNASLKPLHTTLLLQFAEQLVNTMNLDEEGSKLILSCCKAAVKQGMSWHRVGFVAARPPGARPWAHSE